MLIYHQSSSSFATASELMRKKVKKREVPPHIGIRLSFCLNPTNFGQNSQRGRHIGIYINFSPQQISAFSPVCHDPRFEALQQVCPSGLAGSRGKARDTSTFQITRSVLAEAPLRSSTFQFFQCELHTTLHLAHGT